MKGVQKIEVKIQVGRANNGFVLNITPSQVTKIKSQYKEANPLKELFLKFETKQEIMQNDAELRRILPLLTGLSENQLTRFSYEFIDAANNQTKRL